MKHVCTTLFKKLQDKSNEAQTTRSSISFHFVICKLLSSASVFSDAPKHSKKILLRILSYRLDRLKIENILWKIEKCRWELDRRVRRSRNEDLWTFGEKVATKHCSVFGAYSYVIQSYKFIHYTKSKCCGTNFDVMKIVTCSVLVWQKQHNIAKGYSS